MTHQPGDTEHGDASFTAFRDEGMAKIVEGMADQSGPTAQSAKLY
jgi:hypothetical protein